MRGMRISIKTSGKPRSESRLRLNVTLGGSLLMVHLAAVTLPMVSMTLTVCMFPQEVFGFVVLELAAGGKGFGSTTPLIVLMSSRVTEIGFLSMARYERGAWSGLVLNLNTA